VDVTRPTAVVVEALSGPPVGERRVELVQRKWIGHPDRL